MGYFNAPLYDGFAVKWCNEPKADVAVTKKYWRPCAQPPDPVLLGRPEGGGSCAID